METLGAYLLRSGVLAKDMLATALDRQVVYGGWLDTALMELGLSDEATMADHLSRWVSFPLCQPGWLEDVPADAAAPLVPAALAVSNVVVPFAESEEGVWLGVTAPVDTDALGMLAAQLGRPVLPHVTTELRIRLALQRIYGARTDPRFEELHAFLQGRSAPPRPVRAALPAVTAAQVSRSSPPPSARPAATTTAQATGNVVLMTDQVFAADVIAPSMPPPAPQPAPPPPPPPAEKMDLAEALAHLAGARDRDDVVDATLRYAQQTFDFVAFLGVLRGNAVVWAAGSRGAGPVDALKGARIPLEGPSPLKTVVETRAPLLAKPGQSTGGKDLTDRLGRPTPKAILLQPVLVGGRVVGVLYADDGGSPIKTRQASEVLAFASRVGLALENLIREKRARQLPAPPPAVPEPPPEPAPTLNLSLVATAVAQVEEPAPAPTPKPQDDVALQDAPTATYAAVDVPPPQAPPVEEPPPAEEKSKGRPVFASLIASATSAPSEEMVIANTQSVFGGGPAPAQPVPAAEPVAAPTRWDGISEEAEPLVANTRIVFGADAPPATVPLANVVSPLHDEEPTAVDMPVELPPDVADLPLDVQVDAEVEVEVDAEGDGPRGPELSRLSPEAAALAAVALARAQAGDDDDEDEDDARDEAPLVQDATWNDAMAEALHEVDKGAVTGRFEEGADKGWDASIAAAAAQAGTLEKPAYQPLPEDEEDDDAAGEESVVFSDVEETSGASTNAFTHALKETIATGRQGGEAVDEDYRAFQAAPPLRRDDAADDDEDDDEDDDSANQAGWEAVVLDAVERVHAERQEAAAAAAATPAAEAPVPSVVGTPLPVPAAPAPSREEAFQESEGFLKEEAPPLIDPPRVWVDALGSGQPDRVATARTKVLELGEAAVPALIAAFPGRVQFDPFGPDAQPPDPATLSPVMDVLARLGHVGLQAAIQHLDSRYPAHRFFATLLMSRVYHPASIPYLLRRLHDDEPRIRKLAGDALGTYVAEPSFEQVVRHLRLRINSVTPEGRRRAIHFLGRFRDVGSIPALIGVLRAKEADLVAEAAQALHIITLQDHGTSERRWAGWWEKNKARSRIEWLIDALRDGDVEVRARAGSELAQLTRDTFGFRADGPRKDREVAIKRWERWWADERRRLTGQG